MIANSVQDWRLDLMSRFGAWVSRCFFFWVAVCNHWDVGARSKCNNTKASWRKDLAVCGRRALWGPWWTASDARWRVLSIFSLPVWQHLYTSLARILINTHINKWLKHVGSQQFGPNNHSFGSWGLDREALKVLQDVCAKGEERLKSLVTWKWWVTMFPYFIGTTLLGWSVVAWPSVCQAMLVCFWVFLRLCSFLWMSWVSWQSEGALSHSPLRWVHKNTGSGSTTKQIDVLMHWCIDALML